MILFTRILVVVLTALFISGCGKKVEGRLSVFPVRGSVVSKGRPLDGAVLLFHPKNPILENLYCYAKTKSDGTFEVSTYDANDGAPEGDYVVTMTWPTISVDDGGYGDDRLQGKFNNPLEPKFHAKVTKPSTELPPFEVP